MGKVFAQKQQELVKLLKNPELDSANREKLQSQLDQVTQYLKTTNLQKQWANASQSQYVIVYSRAPIDVLRMGDFDWGYYSCHAPDGSYFYCALADAMLNAGISYLIKKEDYDKLISENKFQDPEIFEDEDRGIGGIQPLARMRIRLVLDMKGNQLAVPTLKIYAVKGQNANDLYKKQIIEWAKKQDVSDIDWESSLTLKGGSYEDEGNSIYDEISKIWGKNIYYVKDMNGEESNDGEEAFYDQVKEAISNAEDELKEEFCGDGGRETRNQVDVNTNGYDRFELSIYLGKKLLKKVNEHDENNRKSFNRNEYKYPDPISIKKKSEIGSLPDQELGLIKIDNDGIVIKPNFHVHDLYSASYEGEYSSYDMDNIKEEMVEYIWEMIRIFTDQKQWGKSWSFDDERDFYLFKMTLVNKLLEKQGKPLIDVDFDDIEFFYDNLTSFSFEEFKTPKSSDEFWISFLRYNSNKMGPDEVENSFEGKRAKKFIMLISHWHNEVNDRIEKAYKLSNYYGGNNRQFIHIELGIGLMRKNELNKRVGWNGFDIYSLHSNYRMASLTDDDVTVLKISLLNHEDLDGIIAEGDLKKIIKLYETREHIHFDDFEKSLKNFFQNRDEKFKDQMELDLSSFRKFYNQLINE